MQFAPMLCALLVAVLGTATSACALSKAYHGAAIEGWVVDAETGQLIDNAIVAIKWELEGGLHPDVIGSILLQETVTDANGHYAFPPWGPLRLKKGYLKQSTPLIVAFKLGYEPEPFWNAADDPSKPRPNPLVSQWSGRKLALKPLRPAELSNHSYSWGFSVFTSLYHSRLQCEWEQIPRMTAAMLMYDRIFERATGLSSGHGILTLNGAGPDACRDPKDHLRAYLDE